MGRLIDESVTEVIDIDILIFYINVVIKCKKNEKQLLLLPWYWV